MPTYKTPDVYVEEISIFPPSVAEVESAVPCFIGYTEKAMEHTNDDLLNKAEKIKSMVDYERYYGKGPPLVNDYTNPNDRVEITLDENNGPQSVTLNTKFLLYYSLKLFFDNGGGKCYIISVGNYKDTITYGSETTASTMRYGLEVLKKVDEPTIICFPDAVLLSGDGLYNLQVQALKQCGKLMDRVLICDLMNSGDHDDDVEAFRGKIGINNLKYGAAYTPWLKTSLQKNIKYRDIKLIRTGGSNVLLENLTKDSGIKDLINLIKKATQSTDKINKDIIKANKGTSDNCRDNFKAKISDYESTKSDPTSTIGDLRSKLKVAYDLTIDIVISLVNYGSSISDESDWKLKTSYDAIVSDNGLKKEMQDLVFHSNAFKANTAATSVIITPAKLTALKAVSFFSTIDETLATPATITTSYTSAADDPARADLSKTTGIGVFNAINSTITEFLEASLSYEATFEDSLRDAFGTYKTIVQKINSTLATIPPSGAIAGIYSFVDRTRGVHKAPANVSLNSVSKLTVEIDFEDQKDLNVDVNAGKSLNAIRSFAGKGILVWGARTLAGNDNEWRYVPVRRFFNMVEESVKKSTYWAVFEPNDANLWVRVKGMIQNYLFQKWRDGALAGAVPEDAYFVNVGLGLTMTPQDILEGRMNVEIGMAVVRPAEFIILKFSHKMQES